MKKLFSTVFIFLLAIQVGWSQEPVSIFKSGDDGYKSYRIPAIVAFSEKKIIAIAEGRVNNAGDYGNIDIVMKSSNDGGRTWSALKQVVDVGNLQAGNPAPVIDMQDPRYPKGRIFIFYNVGNDHEGEVRKGNGYRTVWYVASTDQGQTWGQPVEITTQVHRPNKPDVNPSWNFKEDWRSYANTPGHAMQIKEGKYKGRIFVAANHSAGNPQSAAKDYQAHGFYTDDHGDTFQLGATVEYLGSNESTAAELSDSRLMMNSRNQQGNERARIISISSDGGATWDTTFVDHNLPDPVNQGSILNVGKKKGKNILAFSNAADQKNRDNLTLRISYDDGKTLSKSILVDKSEEGYKGAWTAYSDIVKLGKKKIGILYEKDGYTDIVFKSIKWK